jgi:hypothetical protein
MDTNENNITGISQTRSMKCGEGAPEVAVTINFDYSKVSPDETLIRAYNTDVISRVGILRRDAIKFAHGKNTQWSKLSVEEKKIAGAKFVELATAYFAETVDANGWKVERGGAKLSDFDKAEKLIKSGTLTPAQRAELAKLLAS